MLRPVWSIDHDCQSKTYLIDGVIKLSTNDLNGKFFQWEHYGGKLAIWRLGQWVRYNILGDMPPTDQKLPEKPNIECYKQGQFIAQKIGELPE